MKSYLILILVSLLALTGCKPKQTNLSGQVFIVTQGAENVKLGDVEILLIEKSQATDFLQKKQPTIETEMQSRQQELAVAKKDLEKAQADFNSFFANRPYEKTPDQIKVLSQLDANEKEIAALEQRADAISDQSSKIANNKTTYDNDANSDAASATITANGEKIDVLTEAMQPLIDEDKALLEQLNEEETNKLKVAESVVSTAESRSNNSPTAEDYFKDFSPIIIQKTLTDADGKFYISYPRNKVFSIFASAQRMVLNKTEKYYWLVNAPTNAESVQIFLSNNNLVEIDPDGYFALKPKAASQESSTQ